MLWLIDTKLVVVHGGVDEIRGELPTIRETARGLTELLDQVALLKGTTVSLQTELGSILEKVTELVASDRRSSKPAASSYDAEEDSIRSAKVQTILPALREALSRLTVSFQICLILLFTNKIPRSTILRWTWSIKYQLEQHSLQIAWGRQVNIQSILFSPHLKFQQET